MHIWRKDGARLDPASPDPVAGSPLLPPASEINLNVDRTKPRIGLLRRNVLAESLYFGALNAALAIILMMAIWSAASSVLNSASTAFVMALAGTPMR